MSQLPEWALWTEMSGGHFDYKQNFIYQMAFEIERLIAENDDQAKNEFGERKGYGYPPEVINEFRTAVSVLRQAYVYAQRIDWLICDDDGPDTFLSRLKEELEAMK